MAAPALSVEQRDRLHAVLRSIYYSASAAASFSSAAALLRVVKARLDFPVRRKDVQEWLDQQYTYNVHKQTHRSKRDRFVPYVTSGPFQSFSCDLAYLGPRHFGERGIPTLVCGDAFTSMLYAEEIKGRAVTGRSLNSAFNRIIEQQTGGNRPMVVYTDGGSEFRRLGDVLSPPRKHKVSATRRKAAQAESFIGKLRAKIQKTSTHLGKKTWPALKEEILAGINSTPISRLEQLNLAPKDITVENAGRVFNARFGDYVQRHVAMTPRDVTMMSQFKVGTPVRINIPPRDRFVKKSAPKFTSEVFYVRDIQPSDPLKYKLSDRDRERIPGSFYARELQRAESEHE